MKLLTSYGSPTPPGKLSRALDIVADSVRTEPGWTHERLAPGERLSFTTAIWPEDALAAVASADAVVIGSPVFRAAPPGTLKLLIDALSVEALRSKPVALLTVAAAREHALASERHLRDVLAWFGALTAPNSLFLPDVALAQETVDDDTRGALDELARQVLRLAERTHDLDLGPAPLAARRS
jgi:FMN reductase